MKFSILLACFAATTALARPSRHYDDDDKYTLDYNFTMKAFRLGRDSDRNEAEKIGVHEVGFNAPLVMGHNMLWRLEDGVLSPAEHPDYKVDVSLLRIYPPRVALLPRSFQTLPGYKVEVREEKGEMMIRVAKPVLGKLDLFFLPLIRPRKMSSSLLTHNLIICLDQIGTFTGIRLRKDESLIFLPFGEAEIGVMAEKQKDNQRYHSGHRSKDSDFLFQCNHP